MLGVDIAQETNISPEDVRASYRQRLKDAGTKGFAVANDRVPKDTGKLQQSLFPPEWRKDKLVYGSAGVGYADDMEFGTDPFYPDVQPLVEWAERKGLGAGFGYYVAEEKIPEEGIDAQPYLRPSLEAARDYLSTHKLDEYL